MVHEGITFLRCVGGRQESLILSGSGLCALDPDSRVIRPSSAFALQFKEQEGYHVHEGLFHGMEDHKT
jgi:hypothetical protein